MFKWLAFPKTCPSRLRKEQANKDTKIMSDICPSNIIGLIPLRLCILVAAMLVIRTQKQ